MRSIVEKQIMDLSHIGFLSRQITRIGIDIPATEIFIIGIELNISIEYSFI